MRALRHQLYASRPGGGRRCSSPSPTSRRAGSCPRTHAGLLGLTAFLLHDVKQPGGANGEQRIGEPPFAVLAFTCYRRLPFPSSNSLFATPLDTSLFTIRFFIRCPFARGVRSAGGAWMHATHPDRHAMTGMQTPLSIRSRATPALRSLRTAGKPRRAIDFANRRTDLREASCVP